MKKIKTNNHKATKHTPFVMTKRMKAVAEAKEKAAQGEKKSW